MKNLRTMNEILKRIPVSDIIQQYSLCSSCRSVTLLKHTHSFYNKPSNSQLNRRLLHFMANRAIGGAMRSYCGNRPNCNKQVGGVGLTVYRMAMFCF